MCVKYRENSGKCGVFSKEYTPQVEQLIENDRKKIQFPWQPQFLGIFLIYFLPFPDQAYNLC